MFNVIDKYVESYRRIISEEADVQIDASKVLRNFKKTEEFKRLSEDLEKEKKDKLLKTAEEAVEEMVEDIKNILGPYNTKNLKFVQFTSPEKKGGYSAGYLIPKRIADSDSIEVKSISPAKKNEKLVKLGAYLTEKAYKKIKDAANG